MLFHSLVAIVALFSLADRTTAAPQMTRQIACNNSPDLCERPYNNITYLGAHDSAFLRDHSTNFALAGNQFYNATVALSAGVRLLQAQVHSSGGALRLCHTSCLLLDAGSLESWLSEVKFWMDNNPNDVVTILLVNSDSNSTSNFGSVFDASSISKYGYAPVTNSTSSGPMSTWPTLGSLIRANTRLVTFITNISPTASYPYLLPEFSYVFETQYDITSLSSFSCDLNRPDTLSSASAAIKQGYLPFLNHFADVKGPFDIEIPDMDNIGKTNSPEQTAIGSVGREASRCQSEWGVNPIFVLVDFFNVAGPIAAVDQLNGITATGRKLLPQTVMGTSGNSGASSQSLVEWKTAMLFVIAVTSLNHIFF